MAPRSVAIDIVEENIQSISPSLLRALLKDKTTGGNIIWATDDYYSKYNDDRFCRDREISEKLITGNYWNTIQPRVAKIKEKQDERTKSKAEVFTPSWICNKQNNLIDEEWFGRKNVFNEEKGKEWITFHDKVEFPSDKNWKDYIDARRLEITCGEAPYLVSRYDTTTGERIKLERRIGLLDRKFRILNENASSDDEWLDWAYRSLQSIYGYEFQGDNVLLARENVLFTFIDNYRYRFGDMPDSTLIKKAINIITWNIWQMDGRTLRPPYLLRKNSKIIQPSLFDELNDVESESPDASSYGDDCLIMDWRKKKSTSLKSLVGKDYHEQ